MEEKLKELEEILETKMPALISVIKESDPATKEYGEYLNNFNASMVIYSNLKEMFAREMLQQMIKENEEKEIVEDGTNN